MTSPRCAGGLTGFIRGNCVLAAILAVTALSSCASSKLQLPLLPETPVTPGGLVAVLAHRESLLHDLQARFGIDLRVDGIRQKGTGALTYRAGDALKLDIADRLLGIGVMSALAHGDSLSVYLHRENRLLRGGSAEVLHTITGVNVAYYGLRRSLLGLPNFTAADTDRVAQFEVLADSLIVEVLDPVWTRHLRFHAPTGVLLEEKVSTPGGRLLSSRHLSDYRMEAGVALPRTVRLRQGDDRITVRYRRRVVNGGITDVRLNLTIPSDAVELIDGF